MNLLLEQLSNDNFILEDNMDLPQEIPEFLPLKKYYLIQKLILLNNKLIQSDIVNDDLNTILKFSNELSFLSLLHLVNGLLPFINVNHNDDSDNKKNISPEVKKFDH